MPHQHNHYVYGNALEALIGAIYIDKGYKQCRRFILDRVFARHLDIESLVRTDKNYKSRLIEWTQKMHKSIEFRLVGEELRKDGTYFSSEVHVDGVLMGVGNGFSKRESQQKAARQAISKIGI